MYVHILNCKYYIPVLYGAQSDSPGPAQKSPSAPWEPPAAPPPPMAPPAGSKAAPQVRLPYSWQPKTIFNKSINQSFCLNSTHLCFAKS